MEIRPVRDTKFKRDTKPRREFFGAVAVFVKGIAKITDTAIERVIKLKIPAYIIKHRHKIIIPALACIVTLVVLLNVSVKNMENSDYHAKGGEVAEFGMAFEPTSTFNHIERRHIAVHLNWTDGAIDLNNGHAEARLTAKVYPLLLDNKEITWTSSDENIAKIDKDGNITASKPGEVTFTASLNAYGRKSEAILSVRQPISGIFMPTSTITLYTGGTGRLLSPSVLPADASNKKVTWKSKNSKVARVDENGRVKPVGAGMTEVIATTEEGGYEAKCFVNVVNPYIEVQEISVLNSGDMFVRVGESINAVVAVSPVNARNKTLHWSSNNEDIASVSQTGRVRGVGEGKATITVQSVNGKKHSFNIEVAASDAKDPFDLVTDDDIITVGTVRYTPYNQTLLQAVNVQMQQNPTPKIWRAGGATDATKTETAEYMNPLSYYTDAYKYQFLDLSSPNNVSADALNAYLADKGVLKGMGEVFIEAANDYNVSEVYLVAHACLESGNGTSRLACGVEVNGTVVYNLFGINAYDANPLGGGSSKAYNEGWTSVESAIRGGAEWISKYYIDAGQNTLYKMLWNPDNMGVHQYATDIGWAVKQAVSIEKIFTSFSDASLSFEVPVYSGQIPPVISAD